MGRLIAADPELLAVVVKAPQHKAAMPIIEAGKDLYIEWPVGVETAEIAEAAKKQGIRTRHSAKIKEILESGQIGRVLSSPFVRLSRSLYSFFEHSAYIADAEQSQTFLHLIGGHFLDGFVHTLGPFTSVSATLAVQYPTTEFVDPTG
ncbi:hypothetical protein C8Q72DRAFT_970444, partial [Fomitopsis betulina]